MHFKMFGPYDIKDQRGHADWLDKEDFDHYWTHVVDADTQGLSTACGVYLFGVRGIEGKRKTVGKTLPWYVGKAEKQPFRKECFNGRNQNEFNRIAFSVYGGKGTPFLYLFARTEEDGTFSGIANDEYPGVRFVEELLIQMSLATNNDLANKQLTSQAQQTSIRSILNFKSRGKPPSSVAAFTTAFDIAKPIQVRMETGTGSSDPKNVYDIFGPYDVPVRNKAPKTIDPEDIHEMWEDIRKGKNPKLLDACGVYVLAIRHGKNVKPWYIGTAGDVTFKTKCLRQDMKRINDIVEKRGAPVIYFLPRLTAKGRLAKASTNDQARKNTRYVRAMLLRYGAQVNPEILSEDESDLKMLRELTVEGLVNSDRRKLRKELKELLGR